MADKACVTQDCPKAPHFLVKKDGESEGVHVCADCLESVRRMGDHVTELTSGRTFRTGYDPVFPKREPKRG